jgi:Skp family chaperone for outer membrane proteins
MDRQHEKVEDAIHSTRSELDETTQHRIDNVMTCVDHKKQGLRKLIEKLQAMKTSFDTRAENFQEALEAIRADFVTDLAVVDLGAEATRKEPLAQQRSMEERLKPKDASSSQGLCRERK